MSNDERNDKYIWDDYAAGVKRIGAKKRVSKKTVSTQAALKVPDLKPRVSGKTGWIPASAGMTQLDKRMERKLRDGDIRIEARLDMHGMTQREAHAALGDFIAVQAARGARNLLIITGKGRHRGERLGEAQSEAGISGAGVLKSNFKLWLENVPEASQILAVRPAAIKHGGAGAFYVILRKPV